MVTLVYHFFVGFFTGMLGTEGCFFSTGYGVRGGFEDTVRWSNSELADEIYELLRDNSEAANSLSSPVSTAPQIEKLFRIPFRC
jgi:uncharacterized protein (DUF849 family)